MPLVHKTMGDMRTTWTPTLWFGTTFFVCRVEAYGVSGEGVSRRKSAALRYALEELAAKVVEGPPAEIPE